MNKVEVLFNNSKFSYYYRYNGINDYGAGASNFIVLCFVKIAAGPNTPEGTNVHSIALDGRYISTGPSNIWF